MKKILISLLAIAVFPVVAMAQGCPTPTTATATVTLKRKIPGLLDGNFSVAYEGGKYKKVAFSQGNLQYTRESTSTPWEEGKFSFMAHQWDKIETSNVSGDYASQTAIGLFGWGTSGWDNTAADATSVHYQPYSTCNTDHGTANNNYQYGPSNAKVVGSSSPASAESWSKEIAGNHPYENYDWGVFNSGDLGAGWRTLTAQEWGYLFNSRTPGNSVNGVADARYTMATINTDGTAVNGIILFPDDANLTTVDGVTLGNINSSGTYGVVSPTSTQCSSAGWTALETAGCVFLPAAGYRSSGTEAYGVGEHGRYWSSSANSVKLAYALYFYSGYVTPHTDLSRYIGYSVRLVKDVVVTP